MHTSFRFDGEEMAFLEAVNKSRTAANVAANANNIRYSETDDLKAGMIGLMGEFALSKMLGTPRESLADVTPRSCSRGDEKADGMYKGVPIDIKTTQKRGAPMWVARRKSRSPAQIFGLAYCDVNSRTCEIKGFMPRSEVLVQKYLQTVPSRISSAGMLTFVVPPGDLRPLTDIQLPDEQTPKQTE